jgi:hypothetical protein
VVHLKWNSPESLFGSDTPQENLLFVKPESLWLTDKKIHYLWKRPESLLLKGGGDTHNKIYSGC